MTSAAPDRPQRERPSAETRVWSIVVSRQQARARVTPPEDAPQKRDWPPERSSAHVRAAHQLQCRFDVPPGFGLFVLTLLLQGTCFLSGLGHGLVAVRLQQPTRVVLDFDFLHSHGVMLLSSSAAENRTAPKNSAIDTHQDLQVTAYQFRRERGTHPG